MMCIIGVNIQMLASLHQLFQSGGKRTDRLKGGHVESEYGRFIHC